MPSPEEIERHYESASTFRSWQKEEDARRRLWNKRLAVIERFAPGNRLLDIGTGDGRFLEMAAEDFTVTSTEISRQAIELAERRGFHPIQGTLREIDFGDIQFDVITLWHVLEHLPSPSFTLERLHELTNPGGIAVIAVPNEVRLLPGKRLERKASSSISVNDEIHLYFWTPRSLRAVLQAHGWNLVWQDVDDVHVNRNPWVAARYRLNVLLSRWTGWHFDPAMIAVCQDAA